MTEDKEDGSITASKNDHAQSKCQCASGVNSVTYPLQELCFIVLMFQENKSFGASTICIHPLMYVKPCREQPWLYKTHIVQTVSHEINLLLKIKSHQILNFYFRSSKGTVQWDFWLPFFHLSTYTGPNIFTCLEIISNIVKFVMKLSIFEIFKKSTPRFPRRQRVKIWTVGDPYFRHFSCYHAPFKTGKVLPNF